MKDDVFILIPAYNPDIVLEKIIDELQENNYKNIVVIDDGSKEKTVFNKIKNKIILLQHTSNQGKGIALKTGLDYCINNLNNIKGIITVDADGQHQLEDINKVYLMLKRKPNHIVLGSRNFHGKNIPFRSRLGNIITSYILMRKTKVKINDTQTGLRAIPSKYIREIKEIKGKKYEYEMNMLLYCIRKRIGIQEVPIESIYLNKNKTSNFNIIKDSLQIYNAIIKS